MQYFLNRFYSTITIVMGKKRRGWNDDHYTKKAKDRDFKARSAFKLEEIDRKYRIFRKGMRVLDLGCSPGSWLQYTLRKIGHSGEAVGIDLKETNVAGARCIRGDIYNCNDEELGTGYDAVISDMAPDTTGQPFVDAQRSLELCRRAFELAKTKLKPGGCFICKIFQGEDLDEFARELKGSFKPMSRFKPDSSREKSREIFLIGQNFKG